MEETQEVQTSLLYNGEVVVEFNPNAKRNRYKITDRGVLLKPAPPSVTTICDRRDKSGALMHWAVKNALMVCEEKILPDQIHSQGFLNDVWAEALDKYKEVKRKAADVGTLAHRALEDYFTLPEDQFAPPLAGTPVRARFDEAVKWFNSHKIESVATEARIYSRKYGYTGTLDHLSKVDGVLSLLDYKSSKGIYQTHGYQIAAYIMGREEDLGERIEQAYILKIGEDVTTPYLYDRQQLETAFEGFLGLLQEYRADRKLGTIKPQEVDWIEAL